MKNILMTIIILVILIGVLITPEVFACSPGGPDPWFSTSITFDKSNFPAGLEITINDDDYESYALINKSKEPFYIVKKNNTNTKTFPKSELPTNYEPQYKLVDNKSFYYLNNEYIQDQGGINNSATSSVKLNERIYTLDGESKQIHKDNRPDSFTLPPSQSVNILGYYNNKPLVITGTLNYSLNQKYDPTAYQKGIDKCAKLNRLSSDWTLPGLFLIVILVIWLIINKFKKRTR